MSGLDLTPMVNWAMALAALAGGGTIVVKWITGGLARDVESLEDDIEALKSDIAAKMKTIETRQDTIEQHRASDIERIVRIETSLISIERSMERVHDMLTELLRDIRR